MALDMALEEVTVTRPDNAVAELQAYFASPAMRGGEMRNVLCRMGDMRSVLQIDPQVHKIYHYNFDHRPIIFPLREALKNQFPDYECVDISGARRHTLAQDSSASTYQTDELHVLTTPEQAINKISSYRREKEFKGLHIHGQGMYGKPAQPAAGKAPAPVVPEDEAASKHRPG